MSKTRGMVFNIGSVTEDTELMMFCQAQYVGVSQYPAYPASENEFLHQL